MTAEKQNWLTVKAVLEARYAKHIRDIHNKDAHEMTLNQRIFWTDLCLIDED